MLRHLLSFYGELLMEQNSEFRLAHQKLACEVRDTIAEITAIPAEEVQNFCEACAYAAMKGK